MGSEFVRGEPTSPRDVDDHAVFDHPNETEKPKNEDPAAPGHIVAHEYLTDPCETLYKTPRRGDDPEKSVVSHKS